MANRKDFTKAVALLLPVAAPFLSILFAQDGPESVIRGTKEFKKSVIVSGLAGPWEMTWGPDNMLWVTERTGKRVTRVNPSTGEKKVAITLDEVSAPGGQDGLLGMALDLKRKHVYVAYTYVDKAKGPDTRVQDPANPYRFLYGKIVRLDYDAAKQTLSNPVNIVTGLPAGNDHNGMRLKIGPDQKLYITHGDQGNNQLGNFCLPVLAQRLPTQKELDAKDFSAYEGKSLRINLDGSVPKDNPKLDGVVSHVYTYGHRNTQGIDFGPDGTLYAAEHGPKTDDEIDILVSGGNYGWPNVAGMRDNKAFEYARWAEASGPKCSELRFSDLAIHPAVPREPESAFTKPMIEPIATLFTVPTGFNFKDPACKGVDYICWPTVGISGVEYYGPKKGGIPGWDRVLLITTLKRGSLYVLPLTADGKKAAGHMHRYFQSENRFRDTALHPNGRTIYIATDPNGLAESANGGVTSVMQDKGAILAFTYVGEGDPNRKALPEVSSKVNKESSGAEAAPTAEVAGAVNPAQFTLKQVNEGKKAYDGYCAVCHGSTLTNGTFGTPLGGEYFKGKWAGKPVSALFEKSRKTMPPASPGSLPASSYANIVAYILEVNGNNPGANELPAGGDALKEMRIGAK
jgi:PQQ-dependent dehydrogenase (s-GDH family)